jgi:hypothetical protein
MFKALVPRTIWLIGISLSLVVLSLSFIRYWMPNDEEAKMKIANANALIEEANKGKKVAKKKLEAVVAIRKAEQDWIPYVETRTPIADVASGGINVNVNPMKLLLDTKRYRNNVQRAINKQLLYGGVVVVSGPEIPGVSDSDDPNALLASYYNYPAVPFPVNIYDLAPVTIRGSYDQIMKHVRAWATIPRYLAVAHNLAITGTAPTLTATYDLSVVGYVRYDGVYAPVPLVTGGGAGGSASVGGGSSFGRPGGGPPSGGRQSGIGGPPTGGPPAGIGGRPGGPPGAGK